MQKLGVVEDTLFVPMLGRIYASEHCPQILYDKKALELKNKLPSDLIEQNMQNQYTLLASASRSANMDRIIRDFLERRPNGAIVQLGCGLETTYYRCDNGRARWYAVDLPHVIEYRRGLLPEPERECYISGNAFAKDWIKKVRDEVLDTPILVIAGGLFHYFAIVQLGCGLETTYYRCDNGRARWYAVDLPHVIEYRRGLLPEPERECYISGNAFAKDWIKKVRDEVLDTPILVIAGGLFHYFEENKVIALLRMIGQFGNMEVVFDTVNRKGMAMMQKKYMRQVGHADAQMFFYVDAVEELAAKIGGNAKVIADEPYYRYIPKNGLKMSTKVSMAVSDWFCMVKMIQLKL